MSRRAAVPARARAAPPIIARKAKGADHDECPYCQQKARVSQPGDPLEHEADRAADAVMNRAALPALNPAAGQFHRDPNDLAPRDEPRPKSGDARTIVDALAQTPAGRQLVAQGAQQGMHTRSNPAGAVAGLASAHRPLPFQAPAVPLGQSGLRAGLDRREPKTPPAAPPAPIHAPAPAPLEPRKKDGAVPVQRKANSRQEAPAPVAETIDESGAALDSATRRFMEQRFGRDFSAVRIHTGPRSARATDALRARAFTYGEHVVFASGEYHPATESGRRLLAHELAHVAQQGAAPLHASASSVPMRRRDAAGVVAPLSAAPANLVSRADAPEEHETDVDPTDLTRLVGMKCKVKKIAEKDDEKSDDGAVAYTVDPLFIPPSKGERALPFYQQFLKEKPGALTATVDIDTNPPRNTTPREDAGTEHRKTEWLAQLGWPDKGKEAAWIDAGGGPGFPQLVGKTCQLDHIVELQVGGQDARPNFQMLNSGPNQSAGSTIKWETVRIAQAIAKARKDAGLSKQTRIRMVFTEVAAGVPPGAPAEGGKVDEKCRVTRTPGAAFDKDNVEANCLAIETCAKNAANKDATPSAPQQSATYTVKASGNVSIDFKVPQSFEGDPKAPPVALDTGENVKAAGFIKNLTAKSLQHVARTKNSKSVPPDTITFEISKNLKTLEGVDKIEFPVRLPDKTLDFSKKPKGLRIKLQGMSPGEITSFTPGKNGIDFAGTITPAIPFLGKLGFQYESSADKLWVTKGLDKKDFKSPIPGLSVEKSEVKFAFLPQLEASGELGFSYKQGAKKLFDLSLTASADEKGFAFGGDLKAYVPGVDSATGHVDYTLTNGWSGKAELSVADLSRKFKFVSGGQASVSFRNNGEKGIALGAEGSVTLNLPHAQNATLSLLYDKGNWLFKGGATFDVPRLNTVTANLAYDGAHLSGEVRDLGFKYQNFAASINLHFLDGKITGDGSVEIKKARVKGTLNVHLHADQHFTGSGELTIEIKEGVEATAGVELGEHEVVRVKGKLAFTKPIHLFDAFGDHATIFTAHADIPIPGLSIPGVGVMARIGGGLAAGYQIGPGQIENAQAEVNFKPLEENHDLTFRASGLLRIDAQAEISGSITGGVVLSVGLAEAGGALTVTASALLKGGVQSNLEFNYEKSVYSAEADFAASLGLAIMLALDASVFASVGIGPIKAGTDYHWNLASTRFDTGLKLGIKTKKKLKYSSDKGLDIPGPSDIDIESPKIDPERLIGNVFKASDQQKKEPTQ
ncbi:hypothetical protein CR51_41455 [Caballeronia megalochromosomata]|nr:hypothetical protein CR51_41455 [Caballeronia megalochromosomata]